jgi:glutamine synthetase
MSEGIDDRADPGEPEQRNIYDVMEEVKEKYVKIPISLGEALDALEQDETVRSALPGELYKVLNEYKRDEWETFLATVTEWDLKKYMDCLP